MGVLGVSERIIGISIISYGKNSLNLRPTLVTTSPLERIKFVRQGPTVFNCSEDILLSLCVACLYSLQNIRAHPTSKPKFGNYLSPLHSKIC
jgi:hypothetical protein